MIGSVKVTERGRERARERESIDAKRNGLAVHGSRGRSGGTGNGIPVELLTSTVKLNEFGATCSKCWPDGNSITRNP